MGDESMFTPRTECPLCHTPVNDWSSRCPRCRYHPDCDDRDCYNRAQDDVALIARYPGAHPAAGGTTSSDEGWRRFVPAWLR